MSSGRALSLIRNTKGSKSIARSEWLKHGWCHRCPYTPFLPAVRFPPCCSTPYHVPLLRSHPFVLMQYRMDMYLPVVRPLHQLGYDACWFTGAVDVIHHIPYTVYNYKTDFGCIVDSLFHNLIRCSGVYFLKARNSDSHCPYHLANQPFAKCASWLQTMVSFALYQHKALSAYLRAVQHIPQHCAVLQCSGYDSRYIERFYFWLLPMDALKLPNVPMTESCTLRI